MRDILEERSRRIPEGAKLLVGTRLDDYLAAIEGQVNDAATSAKEGRFAHETFRDIIAHERQFLAQQYGGAGIEPFLAFDGNGLPSVESLRADISFIRPEGLLLDLTERQTSAYEMIDAQRWNDGIAKDRIAKTEKRVTFSRGPRGGLEVFIEESAYRDCIDDVGLTTPFYIRYATTEYQVAFGELFGTQRVEHHAIKSPSGVIDKMNEEKQDGNLKFRYRLRNRDLTTRKIGLLKRQDPEDMETMYARTQEARSRIVISIMAALEGRCHYGPFSRIRLEPPFENVKIAKDQFSVLKERFSRPARLLSSPVNCSFPITSEEKRVGVLVHESAYNSSLNGVHYGEIILKISGKHIIDETHLRSMKAALNPKYILP